MASLTQILSQAAAVLRNAGAPISADAASGGADVDQWFRKWAFKNHPDKGGDSAAFGIVSAANDVRKRHVEEFAEVLGGGESAASPDADDVAASQTEMWERHARATAQVWRQQRMAFSTMEGYTDLASSEDVIALLRDLLARGHRKIQVRDTQPWPTVTFMYQGYMGSVVKTTTLKEDAQGDVLARDLARALNVTVEDLHHHLFCANNQRDGEVHLTFISPSSWDARVFGGSNSKYRSFSFIRPVAAAPRKPKDQVWNRARVESALRAGGLRLAGDRNKFSIWVPKGVGVPARGVPQFRIETYHTKTELFSAKHYVVQNAQMADFVLKRMITWLNTKYGLGPPSPEAPAGDDVPPSSEGQPNRRKGRADAAPDRFHNAVERVLSNSANQLDWDHLDEMQQRHGLRRLLEMIGEVYQALGEVFATVEENWWITELA